MTSQRLEPGGKERARSAVVGPPGGAGVGSVHEGGTAPVSSGGTWHLGPFPITERGSPLRSEAGSSAASAPGCGSPSPLIWRSSSSARAAVAEVAKELLGAAFAGILVSDRWSAYAWVDVARRQLCWAHLLRQFRGFQDHGPEARAIGEALELLTETMFHVWHRVRDGTMTRAAFQALIDTSATMCRPGFTRAPSCPVAGRRWTMPRDPDVGASALDLRRRRGCRADEQRGGAPESATA